MPSLSHKFKTATQLSAQQWQLFIKSWLLMFYIRLRMDLTPFKSWKKWLVNQSNTNTRELTGNDKQLIATIRRMVVLASRYHPVNANCLPKSLALKWLLKQYNIDSELKMGLAIEKPAFKGHAWLVHGDLVLNDNTNIAEQYPLEQNISRRPLIN